LANGVKIDTVLIFKRALGLFFLRLKMKTKHIRKVLLCEPSHFSVDYVINPWMKIGSINKTKATSQWKNLANTLTKLAIKIEIIKPAKGLPDMVFAADQALIKYKNLVLSNFHYPQRRREIKKYLPWFKKQNFKIYKLPKKCFFEGSGECVWYGDLLFVGTGFRNSTGVCKFLSVYLNVETKCLELINPKFYHLDTCLFPLNDTTAFYYPLAFSQKSQRVLKKLVKNLIPLADDEANNFAANSLVTDHRVIMQKGNKNFAVKLKDLGYKTVEVDVSEFMKSGGGIHCLVQTLEEEYA